MSDFLQGHSLKRTKQIILNHGQLKKKRKEKKKKKVTLIHTKLDLCSLCLCWAERRKCLLGTREGREEKLLSSLLRTNMLPPKSTAFPIHPLKIWFFLTTVAKAMSFILSSTSWSLSQPLTDSRAQRLLYFPTVSISILSHRREGQLLSLSNNTCFDPSIGKG